MNNKKANKIDEELVCADSFVYCLKNSLGHKQVKALPEKDDPPDFWFIIDGVKYAAEITSIVKKQDYHAHCRELEQVVKVNVTENNIISGTYAIIINKQPKLPKKTSPKWVTLIENLRSFIQNSKEDSRSETVYIIEDEQGKLGIQKVSSDGANVGLLGFMGIEHEGEVQEEIAELMHKRILSKIKKLKKKGVPEVCPHILLIFYDAFGFGDIEDARQALLKVDGYDWFHSVFWVASFTDRPNVLWPKSPGRYGGFLYSKKKEWEKPNLYMASEVKRK
jgi:hypothetical protein